MGAERVQSSPNALGGAQPPVTPALRARTRGRSPGGRSPGGLRAALAAAVLVESHPPGAGEGHGRGPRPLVLPLPQQRLQPTPAPADGVPDRLPTTSRISSGQRAATPGPSPPPHAGRPNKACFPSEGLLLGPLQVLFRTSQAVTIVAQPAAYRAREDALSQTAGLRPGDPACFPVPPATDKGRCRIRSTGCPCQGTVSTGNPPGARGEVIEQSSFGAVYQAPQGQAESVTCRSSVTPAGDRREGTDVWPRAPLPRLVGGQGGSKTGTGVKAGARCQGTQKGCWRERCNQDFPPPRFPRSPRV